MSGAAEPKKRSLPLDSIVLDSRCQSRVALRSDLVAEYVADLLNGDVFPPVVVFYDGFTWWLASGWHRWHAHKQARRAKIAVVVHEGTLRDAILFSVGANAKHGARRTTEDLQHALSILLDDQEWRQWRVEDMAGRLGISTGYCSKLIRRTRADYWGDVSEETIDPDEEDDPEEDEDTDAVGETEDVEDEDGGEVGPTELIPEEDDPDCLRKLVEEQIPRACRRLKRLCKRAGRNPFHELERTG